MIEVLVLKQFCTVTSSPVGDQVSTVVCVIDNLFVLFIKVCFLVARLREVCLCSVLAVCVLQIIVERVRSVDHKIYGRNSLHGVQPFLRIRYFDS